MTRDKLTFSRRRSKPPLSIKARKAARVKASELLMLEGTFKRGDTDRMSRRHVKWTGNGDAQESKQVKTLESERGKTALVEQLMRRDLTKAHPVSVALTDE